MLTINTGSTFIVPPHLAKTILLPMDVPSCFLMLFRTLQSFPELSVREVLLDNGASLSFINLMIFELLGRTANKTK
jgi:hypothetical protein